MVYENPDGITESFWRHFVVPNIRRIKGYKCEKCEATKNLDIHHNDYVDEVSINTLDLLCRKCHQAEHRRLKKEGGLIVS